MNKHPVRHRHLVVLPTFLLLLGLSLVQLISGIPDRFFTVQSNISAVDAQTEFSLASGEYGVLYSGFLRPEEDGMSMDYGEAVLTTDGLARLRIADTRLAAMDGDFYVSADENGLTVAAISTPVYVLSDARRVIVPAGMQWKRPAGATMATLADGFDAWMASRRPTLLPESFIRRKTADLQAVSHTPVPLPQLYADAPDSGGVLQHLLLPTSAEKQLRYQRKKALGALRFAVEQESVEALEAVLRDEFVQEAMHTPYGMNVAIRLLHNQGTSVRMLLLQELASHEDVWALASTHPEYVSVTWSMFEPETTIEAQLARVFTLPFVAQTAEEFPVYVFDRYRATLEGMLQKVGDDVAFTEHVLTTHVPVVFALDESEYPKRARSLRAVLLSLLDLSLEQTDIMRQARDTLSQLDYVAIDPLPLKETKESDLQAKQAVETSSVVELSPEQAEAKAYDMLRTAGAMFSVQSTVAAVAPNTVQVTDVLFASRTEDRTVSFVLDVVTESVSEITVNGNSDFPYSPSFEGFVTWIRK